MAENAASEIPKPLPTARKVWPSGVGMGGPDLAPQVTLTTAACYLPAKGPPNAALATR